MFTEQQRKESFGIYAKQIENVVTLNADRDYNNTL